MSKKILLFVSLILASADAQQRKVDLQAGQRAADRAAAQRAADADRLARQEEEKKRKEEQQKRDTQLRRGGWNRGRAKQPGDSNQNPITSTKKSPSQSTNPADAALLRDLTDFDPNANTKDDLSIGDLPTAPSADSASDDSRVKVLQGEMDAATKRAREILKEEGRQFDYLEKQAQELKASMQEGDTNRFERVKRDADKVEKIVDDVSPDNMEVYSAGKGRLGIKSPKGKITVQEVTTAFVPKNIFQKIIYSFRRWKVERAVNFKIEQMTPVQSAFLSRFATQINNLIEEDPRVLDSNAPVKPNLPVGANISQKAQYYNALKKYIKNNMKYAVNVNLNSIR